MVQPIYFSPPRLYSQAIQSPEAIQLHPPVQPLTSDLLRNVEKLCKMDSFSNRKLQEVTSSKHDSYASDLLENHTSTTEMYGVQMYTNPLLRVSNHALLSTTTRAVLPLLRGRERRLVKNPSLLKFTTKRFITL
jgi:hypothetical protein